LSAGEQDFLIQADAVTTSGQTILPELKLGTVQSVSKPIGFKVMKRRTLKVAVYKVVKADASGIAQITPNLVPDEENLANYLTDVFKPQLNVTVEVRIEPAPLVVNWDVGTINQSLDGNSATGALSVEQGAVEAAKNALAQQQSQEPGHEPFGEHLTVYLVGCEKPVAINAFGVTSRSTKTCWVIGNLVSAMNSNTLIPYDPGDGHLHTIAHEIGQVLLGPGHPGTEFPGPAPLWGTEHSRRLMCAGENTALIPGKMLVKEEWDEAEIWMNSNVQDQE
jgi:hypothetical protein